MKRIASVLSVVSIGLFAGCAGGKPTMVTNYDYHDNYNPRNFSTYHATRDTRLEVVGDTLGADRAAFSDAVARAMHGQHFGHPTNFTTSPGPNAERNMYVVMAFNVAHRRDLCSGHTNLPQRRTGDVTEVQGAWCWGNETQAWVLSQGEAARPGDPAFEQLVAATTRELFTRNPDVELYEDEGGGGDEIP